MLEGRSVGLIVPKLKHFIKNSLFYRLSRVRHNALDTVFPLAIQSICPQVSAQAHDYVDVKKLISELPLEELNEAADEYYQKNLEGKWYFYAKPFGSPGEAPELAINFAVMIEGLKLCKGQKILDFGAGSAWSSRFLNQMGLEVYALDVSQTVLKLGKDLFERNPVAGKQPAFHFLHFDSLHIPLPSETVDRVLGLDTFHHVPNQEVVLREILRVLKPGGIAGFSEPGPRHSKTPQSQCEMRNFVVIENDIHIEEIERIAKQIGFTQVKVAVHSREPLMLEVPKFKRYLKGEAKENLAFCQKTLTYMQDARPFFLYKAGTELLDSRTRNGLSGRLFAKFGNMGLDRSVYGTFSVVNSGGNDWLDGSNAFGGVNIGVHLYSAEGKLINRDFARIPLSLSEGQRCKPGESLEFKFHLPIALACGCYKLVFDLVSEGVCWFEENGCSVVNYQLDLP